MEAAYGLFMTSCAVITSVLLYKQRSAQFSMSPSASRPVRSRNPSAMIQALSIQFLLLRTFPSVSRAVWAASRAKDEGFTAQDVRILVVSMLVLHSSYSCSFDTLLYIIFNKRFRRNTARILTCISIISWVRNRRRNKRMGGGRVQRAEHGEFELLSTSATC